MSTENSKTSHISNENLERKITVAILNGAKTADVAEVNGLKYAQCREMLHKYCKQANKDAYDAINVDAASQDCNSPFLEELRRHKNKFIPNTQPRDQEFLKREIESQNAVLEQAQITLSAERAVLDQLQAELKEASS